MRVLAIDISGDFAAAFSTSDATRMLPSAATYALTAAFARDFQCRRHKRVISASLRQLIIYDIDVLVHASHMRGRCHYSAEIADRELILARRIAAFSAYKSIYHFRAPT